MSKEVFTFEGGNALLVGAMKDEMTSNGVDVRIRCLVESIEVTGDRKVAAVVVNGRRITCGAVVSNANIKQTVFELVGEQAFDREFAEEARAVRLNNSSCQVYIAMKPGIEFEPCGDLLFHSEHRGFDIDATDAEIRYSGVFAKPAGTKATVTGRIVNPGGTHSVDDIRLKIANLDAHASLETGDRTLPDSGTPSRGC